MSTIQLSVQHYLTQQVHAEVNACHGKREVTDRCAVTIASWYASPGVVGRHLAALSTGAPVDLEDLRADISATIAEVYDTSNAQERRCLDMLGTWAINRDRLEHVDYPHNPGTLYDCPACEVIDPELAR